MSTSVSSSKALFRVVPHSLYQIGTDQWLVYMDQTGRVIECDGSVLSILKACRGCRPFEGHLSLGIQRGSNPDARAVGAVLSQLVEAGLLCEYLHPSAALDHRAHDTPPRLPTTLAIVTAERPWHLGRCARSFLSHFREHGHAVRLLVVDGSRRRESREANLASLRECAREGLGQIDVIDPEALEAGLRRTAGTSAAVRFLLTGGATGANRNVVLLATAGEDVLMVDDDMVCEPWSRKGRRDVVTLAAHSDLRHLAFFPTRAEALKAVLPADVDLLAVHGRLLGRRVDELAGICDMDSLSDGCVHMTAAVDGQPPLRVRATFAGLAGDAGTYCPQTLLFSSGRWKAALSTPAAYEMAIVSRECHRIADTYVVTHDPHFMAGCVALDNTAATPPFIPFGRNEDGVFGVMLAACEPDVAYAHIPFGVVHDADPPDTGLARQCLAATETRISEALIALLQSHSRSAVLGESVGQIFRLGVWCEALAAMDHRAFGSLLIRALLERRQRELALIDSAVSGRLEYPDYWVRDMISYREILLDSMTVEAFFTPVEIRGPDRDGAALPRAQAFIGDFGAGLQEWQDLWQLCRSRGAEVLALSSAASG